MVKWIINKVDKFFFEPQYVKDLALTRIVLVSIQLFFLTASLFGLNVVNGANINVQAFASSIDQTEFLPVIILKFLLAPFGWGARPEFMLLQAIWFTAIISGFTSLIGKYKKLSLFIFAFTNTILTAHKYSYWEQHHHEAVLIIFLWVLAFGENYKTWSLDNLKRRIIASKAKMKFEPRDRYFADTYSRWPLRVMQWIFVLTYFSAGIEKLKGGFNSYSLMLSFFQDGTIHQKSIALWLSSHPMLLEFLVPVTLIFELTFIIVMFVPSVTWLYVLFGSIFHISIFIIHAPPFYHYAAMYIIFIEPIRNTLVKKFKLKRKAIDKWKVIYDELCPLCIRTVTIIDYFDLRKKINFIDLENEKQNVLSLNKDLNYDDLKHSMHLISPSGKIYKGFYAFEKLTSLLPILWLTVPFLKIPFVDKIGSLVYSKIARNRKLYVCNEYYCRVN